MGAVIANRITVRRIRDIVITLSLRLPILKPPPCNYLPFDAPTAALRAGQKLFLGRFLIV